MEKKDIKRFLLNAGIGYEIKIYLKNGSNKSYILKGMDNEYLYVEDITGFDYKLNIERIEYVESTAIGNVMKEINDKTELFSLNEFIKEKNKLGGNVYFNASDLFAYEIDSITKRVDSVLLKEYLSSNRGRMNVLNGEQAVELYDNIQKLYEEQKIDRNIWLIGNIIILLASRKYKECVAQCFRMLNEDENFLNKRKVYLCLTFVMNQLKDEDQSFYWLEKYFMSNMDGLREIGKDSLWWRYLRNTVEFASYERLDKLLEQIFKHDSSLACQSLAYVLALNNANVQASYVRKLIGQPDVCWETVYSAFLSLKSEKDNKYHRFLRCIYYIITKGKYKYFEKDTDIKGLVYDYVPHRCYGFILGFDMIKYFFHLERTSNVTIKNIKDELCSFKDIEEEEICMVTFNRSSECKRAYEAFDVI